MSGDKIRVKAGLDDLSLVRAFVERHAHTAGLSRDRAADLVLAVDEAVSNCVEHGLRGDEGDAATPTVEQVARQRRGGIGLREADAVHARRGRGLHQVHAGHAAGTDQRTCRLAALQPGDCIEACIAGLPPLQLELAGV